MIGQATLTLPQMLKEMDQAIGDELNEIKKNSQSKHTAVNGQLVSEQTKHYIYQFTLENPWDPQDDTPVKISFFGATEIKATIVTSTGFIITIATEELLPPEALNKVYLIDDPTELLVRLREALKNNKEDSTEIGSKCFALKPSTQLPAVPMRYLGEKFKPDDSQEKAIQMALRNETTYIIGPPGTGKTSTLAAIAYAFLRVGKSVLIAAHTNIAVDNAIMRLADICKYENFSLKEAPIIRYGTPQLEETFKNKYKEVYLPDIVKEHNRYLSEQLLGLRHKLDSYLMQLTKLDQEYKRQPDTWLQEKPNLLARQQQENNELQEIKAREEQRMANLKTQWNAFNTKKVEAEKELNGIIQKLNHLNSQQVQLTVAKGTSEAKAKELSHKLSIAQQTNAVMRMVKGMNKGTIEKDLTDSQYQLWQYNQQLSGIQKQMSEQYYQRSALEQQIQQYRTSSQTIEMQLPMPSNDRLRLEHLQKSLEEIKQRIVQEDARHKQEQANLDQQKRLLNDELTKIKEQMAGIEKQLSDIEKIS